MANRTFPAMLRSFCLIAIAAALLLPVAPRAYADTPPHAPAHGWRKKHDPYYLGYTGTKWEQDYGIPRASATVKPSGRCWEGLPAR